MAPFRFMLAYTAVALAVLWSEGAVAQQGYQRQHTRGKLWENVQNDGYIGSLGAWDYIATEPMGLYPGFKGYAHPASGEQGGAYFTDPWDNSNMHNFKAGVWIVGKAMTVPGLPPAYAPEVALYEAYLSGLEADPYGVQNVRQVLDFRQNFLESASFDPQLPEELITGTWNTNTGITVTRRSYAWGFPGYRDFIIYDYVFKNTGIMVSTATGEVVPGFPSATLSNIRFVFNSGVAVSTKSQINFHTDKDGHNWQSMAAGGFGYDPISYHDYYHLEDGGTLAYSTNINGGKEPLYGYDTYTLKDMDRVRARFGNELESPAAFGWLALYADPLPGSPARTTPKPDVLRIDCNQGGTLNGQPLKFEGFRLGAASSTTKKQFYDFASSPDTQAALGNDGHRFNFYTFSYGPYTLAPGDSVRIIIAEIAGVMDYNEVIAGDPSHHFPDSTLAAIRRNAQNCRNALQWGLGAVVDGIPLAADVPEPPPAPACNALNASLGDTAILAVSWDNTAETKTITDHSGAVFYDGINDLDGYRVYRSTDFQFTSDQTPPAFRGAAWTRVADIPKADFSQYWDASIARYKFADRSVTYGYKYAYYVAGYRNQPKPWTSANGTLVPNPPPLESGDYNHTDGTKAAAGPVYDLDVFVAPNPYVYGDNLRSFGSGDPYSIEFRKLPDRCTIRIYTLTGDLVRELTHQPDASGNQYGTEVWDQKSSSGLMVSPGLYIYHVESNSAGISGSKTGKLMIIR